MTVYVLQKGDNNTLVGVFSSLELAFDIQQVIPEYSYITEIVVDTINEEET